MNYQPATPFGKWVLRVLQEHGATLRSQRQRTGLSHTTVLGWIQDVRPTMEGCIQFARGFGENVNEALRLARYEPLPVAEPIPDFAWNAWLVGQLRALVAEFPGVGALPMPVECISAFGGLAEPMSEEDAREMYETTRMLFEEEWRRLHGSRHP